MGDGEDGPTHQPVEQLVSLRAIPGLVVLRPGDANEVVEAYRYIMQLRHQPAVMVLSRQPLPTLDRTQVRPGQPASRAAPMSGGRAGAESPRSSSSPRAARSRLAVDAHEKLVADGIRSRVVSMPSWDIFEHQPHAYREERAAARRKGAGRRSSRDRPSAGTAMSAPEGRVIGMKTFGASAPLKELQRKFGFEPEHVVSAAMELLGRR